MLNEAIDQQASGIAKDRLTAIALAPPGFTRSVLRQCLSDNLWPIVVTVPLVDMGKGRFANSYQTVNMRAMRRSLVLTDESARHPFRISLPPHVLARAGEIEHAVHWTKRLGLTRKDAQTIAATYTAGFLATTAFFM